MNWRETWNAIAASTTDPEKQVGRVPSGKSGSSSLLVQTATHISRILRLSPADVLLDVCCGNGGITFYLAKECKTAVGVDFCPVMIQLAGSNYTAGNIRYITGDAQDLPDFPEAPFDKISLNYSFQYFEQYTSGRNVVSSLLKLLKPGGLLLLGEVPNHEKRWRFYHTWQSRIYLVYHALAGKNLMGKFWKQQELDRICRELHVKGTRLEQPAHLPYAHYRFDYLIEKL